MATVQVTKSAQKELLSLPKNITKLISRKLLILKDNPLTGKVLSGKLKGTYSIRVWPYRALYFYDKKTKLVTVYKIQHRKEVYKN